MFSGVIPVAPTTFDRNGELDLDGYEFNIDRLITAGVHGIITLATAGEGPSMSVRECTRVVEAAIAATDGRVPVFAGIEGFNERATLKAIDSYRDAGVDGFVISPHFQSLTRSELTSYLRRQLIRAELPVMIYNAGAAGLPLVPDVLAELLDQSSNFVALMEGNHEQVTNVIGRFGDRLNVLSARDLYMHEMLGAGGSGAVAFTAPIVPDLVLELYRTSMVGDVAKSREIQDRLDPLIWFLVRRSFPSAIKAAMEIVGLQGGHVRAPLTGLDNEEMSELQDILNALRTWASD